MNKDEDKLLQMCICKAISLEGKIWIKEDDNKKLYEKLKKDYQGKITSRYCPACEEKMRNEIKRIEKLLDYFPKT